MVLVYTYGISESVLIQIDNLGVPRVGILITFAGEYRDSVRFDYRVLDEEEGDPVVLVIEYSEDGEVWKVCSVSIVGGVCICMVLIGVLRGVIW